MLKRARRRFMWPGCTRGAAQPGAPAPAARPCARPGAAGRPAVAGAPRVNAADCALAMACGTSAPQAGWHALLWSRDVRHALRTCRVPPRAGAVRPGRCATCALHSRFPPLENGMVHAGGIVCAPWQPWQEADRRRQGPCDARSLWHGLRCDSAAGSPGCDAVSPGAGAACPCGHAAAREAGQATRARPVAARWPRGSAAQA